MAFQFPFPRKRHETIQRERAAVPPQLERISPRAVGIVLGLAALALLGVAIFLLTRVTVKTVDRSVNAPQIIEEPKPEPPPAPSETTTGLFTRQWLAEPMRLRRYTRFDPPFEPIDSRNLRSEGRLITLALVDVPELGALCLDEGKSLWICGIQARAALFNRIRASALTCRPQDSLDTFGQGTPAGWICRHDGEDLARWFILSGWARPDGYGRLLYAAEAEEARAAKRGLWNGGWTIARVVPSGPGPIAVPFEVGQNAPPARRKRAVKAPE